MKKEIIITIIIIVAIFVFYLITQKYTETSVETASTMLIEIKEDTLAENPNSEGLIKKTQNLDNEWNKKSKLLSFYIEHDELEKVDSQIKRIQSNFKTTSYEDALPEIEQGIYLLQHIKDKRELNLKNIF